MPLSVQRWCDMAKQANEDLNAGGEITETDVTPEPEYVVLKGNHIRHDGEIYRENTTIPVTGVDAERLLKAGVIADIEQLRLRILSAQPSVSVTEE